MKVTKTAISDLFVLEPNVFGDERGFFYESFNMAAFKDATELGSVEFVQDNHSKSCRGVLRGLHYQIKQTQGKLVRVTQGEVFDVAVDMREKSETFGKWVGVILSAENKKQFWIPEGFAHGFFVLSETAEFLYKTTDYYAPEYERTLAWDDPLVDVSWPELDISPLLSDKDRNGKYFADAEKFS